MLKIEEYLHTTNIGTATYHYHIIFSVWFPLAIFEKNSIPKEPFDQGDAELSPSRFGFGWTLPVKTGYPTTLKVKSS